jgi:DNA replication protein DnaC
MNQPTEPTDLSAAVTRLVAAAKKRHDAFAELLARAPRTAPCPQHGGECPLDEEQTLAHGKLSFRCEPCLESKRRAILAQAHERIGVPPDVRHATLGNFRVPNTDVHERSCKPGQFLVAAEGLMNGTTKTLILSGSPGIGKGHIAGAVINRLIHRGDIWPQGTKTAKWISAHRLFAAAHRSYETTGPEPLVEYYSRRHLLILDECAMSDMPRDGQRILYDIVDARQKAADRQMILLTNVTAAALKTWLTAPIVDRLMTGGVKFLWGSWPSLRGTPFDQASKSNEF